MLQVNGAYFETILQHLFYGPGSLRTVLIIGHKQHIAAVNICLDLLISGSFEALFQVRHTNGVFAADIYAAMFSRWRLPIALS